LEDLELAPLAVDILRIVDKVEKVSPEVTAESLKELGLSEIQVQALIGFISLKGAGEGIIQQLKDLDITNKTFVCGLEELETVLQAAATFGLPAASYQVDLSIARGLDYYTGTVYEPS
jgi:histidyl-tRNA synthetase